MSYVVRLHPAVRNDLSIIADYAGAPAAARVLDAIEAAIHRLADTPHSGTRRDEIAPGPRAIPAGRRGVVAFTVDDASRTVFILAVTYAGVDWMARATARENYQAE